MTLFTSVQLAPKDPIFGLTEAYVADQRPDKVNLGVGVYYTDEGKVPLLKAVIKAEEEIVAKHSPRGYIPIEGPNPYNSAVQNLLFGTNSALLKEGRVVTAECIGGTGALRVGADFIKRLNLNAPCAISNPTWENHRGIFEAAGFDVVEYTYFDSETHGVDFAGMVKSLESFPKNTTVLLHACCHNPTGADITEAQWRQVIDICKAKSLIPFLDMAYQGFSAGIGAGRRSSVSPQFRLRLVRQTSELVVVGLELRVLIGRGGGTSRGGLGAHFGFVLSPRLLLGFGDLLEMKQRPPPKETENGKDRPFNRIEVTQRVARRRATKLPPRRGGAARQPRH